MKDNPDPLAELAASNKEGIGEDRLALAFAGERANDLRYVAPWGRWLAWDGTRWDFDDTLHTYDRIRDLCRDLSMKAPARLVAAVEKLARSDRRLAATIDQWDHDHWLLNTPGGVVDLKTGVLRPHQLDDYMTKITSVAPDDAFLTPCWDAFLNLVTGNNKELISLLQRMAGYALTGSTEEHALFFLHGGGDNGKSTFISTVTGIVGDYHRTASIETFTASPTEQHPTDLAGLRGARLVTAIEVEEGRRWAEAKIKALTGGDEIAARFMRCDFFTYTPTFKLMIAANHRPVIRSVDAAIKRRLFLIPFETEIPKKQRIKDFAERRLRAEWPGILAWIISGCLAWQKQGLAPPKAVTEATDAYLADEDAIGTWLEEECTRELPLEWEGSSRLYGAWKEWAEAAGEYVGTQRRFVQKLAARGLIPERKDHARGFRGIRLGKR